MRQARAAAKGFRVGRDRRDAGAAEPGKRLREPLAVDDADAHHVLLRRARGGDVHPGWIRHDAVLGEKPQRRVQATLLRAGRATRSSSTSSAASTTSHGRPRGGMARSDDPLSRTDPSSLTSAHSKRPLSGKSRPRRTRQTLMTSAARRCRHPRAGALQQRLHAHIGASDLGAALHDEELAGGGNIVQLKGRARSAAPPGTHRSAHRLDRQATRERLRWGKSSPSTTAARTSGAAVLTFTGVGCGSATA
jgi:hypothetical protein